jgi:cytochrome c peroxidase
MKYGATIGLMVLVFVVVSCNTETLVPEPGYPSVPAHFPPVPFPPDNRITPEKAELGRRLFYDERLSSSGTVACASCHRPEASFSDAPFQVSEGVDERQGNRNSPTLINVGYRRVLFWDGRVATLEEQAMAAFLHPDEMNADTHAVAALIRSNAYKQDWETVFPDTIVSMHRVMQAIATFERTIVSANSRYDRYLRGEQQALSASELHGMRLFFSEKTQCSGCHRGLDLTDDRFWSVGLFHHYFDAGRFLVTKVSADEGRFKTPTLRNVALTAPYMASGDSEKGLLETLESVVKHYNDGGTTFHNKDPRIKKLDLTDQEQAALVAFMKALTDSRVNTDHRFSRP